MKQRTSNRARGLGWVCFMVCAQVALGTTHHVAQHGDDSQDGTPGAPWRTLQHAVTNAAVSASDHIHVGAGLYLEQVVFPQAVSGGVARLTLRGGFDTNSWTWSPATHPTVIRPPNPALDAIRMHTHSNTLAGLTLTGANRGLYINLPTTSNSTGTIAVIRCVITNNSSHGIFHDGVLNGRWNGIHAENVLIAGNGGDGVHLAQNWEYPNTNLFLHCTIADNAGHGISDVIQYGLPSRIINCIIAGNGGAGLRRSTFSQYSRRTSIADSCFHNNGDGAVLSAGVEDPLVEYQTGVLLTDPGFVGGGDYRLMPGSPAIGAGRDLDSVTEDLEGATRTSPYDLGAYVSAEAPAARHAVTYVDAARPDDSGDGATPATAKQSIGAALAVTAPDGLCLVAAGVYTNEIVLATTGVTLEGAGATNTMLSGSAERDTLIMAASNLTVRGVTIQDGRRGLFLSGNAKPATLTNLRVEDCIVRANGYGVVAPFDDEIRRVYTLERCRIIENSNHGIFHVGAGWPGNYGKFTVLNAVNCLIADNGGDGVNYNVNWEPPAVTYFLHCTIANNAGSGYRDDADWHASVFFTNCIVSGNGLYGVRRATAIPASEFLAISYSCVSENATNIDGFMVQAWPETFTDQSPLFEPGGYTLSRKSPCLDNALDIGIHVDLEGTPRPLQAGFDRGALEHVLMPPTGLIMTVF